MNSKRTSSLDGSYHHKNPRKTRGGLLKTLQIPYNQNHLSQLRRVSTRFPTVSSPPKTQRAPGGDSWEQLPPFVPNNLGLSSPLNICKRHPNKFHYLPAVLECHVCFRDVGWGGCCFDIQVWGWLKRIVFFWEQLLFLGHGLFLVLGRVCEGFTCFGGTPTEHVATRLVQVDFVDFVLGHVVRLLYLLCPKTHWNTYHQLMQVNAINMGNVPNSYAMETVKVRTGSLGAWVWTAVGISLTSASTCINRPQKIKGREDMRRYKIVPGHLVVAVY